MVTLRNALLALAIVTAAAPAAWADDAVAPDASAVAPAAEEEPFISLRAADAVSWCSDDIGCLEPAARVYYNRVDGLLFYVGIRYHSEVHLHPRLTALRGWPSARGSAYYELDVEQPVFGQDAFSFGATFYDRSAWTEDDSENITDVENNLFALLLRQEQRDYFREDGYTLYARQAIGDRIRLALEYDDADLSSLAAQQSVWSVFRRDADWVENPRLTVGLDSGEREFDGRMSRVRLSVAYDDREGVERRGWFARGRMENAKDDGDGDYDYRRIAFDLSRKLRVTDTQDLSLRGSWGVGSGTDFPSHRLFYLGGLGTLRGYPYRAYAGKNMVFASVEYSVRIRPSLYMIYFVDSGEVWNNTSGFDWDEHKTNVGIGVRFEAPGVGDVRIDAARPTMAEDADTIVSLRLVFPS
jgi:outer membrane protein assembly factor BamA